MSAFVFQLTAMAWVPVIDFHWLIVQLLGKAHEDSEYIVMITVMHWHLY